MKTYIIKQSRYGSLECGRVTEIDALNFEEAKIKAKKLEGGGWKNLKVYEKPEPPNKIRKAAHIQIKCPYCDSWDTKHIESGNSINYWKCDNCGSMIRAFDALLLKVKARVEWLE